MESSTAASYETPCQSANDGFRPLQAHDRPWPAARRPARVHEGALGRGDRDRPERPRIHRARRVGEALHGHVRVRARVVEVAVQARFRGSVPSKSMAMWPPSTVTVTATLIGSVPGPQSSMWSSKWYEP